jgi:uncharacterized membrane protein
MENDTNPTQPEQLPGPNPAQPGNQPQEWSASMNPTPSVPAPVVPTPAVPAPSAPAPSAPMQSVPIENVPSAGGPVPPVPPVTPPSGASQPGEPVTIEDTSAGSGEFNNNYQRFAESAGKQMEEAADAIRRGEFVRDAVVDPAADSDDRLVGLLNYVVPVLLPAIVLISESSEKRPFQRFHAVQSLGLSAAMILVGIVVGLVSMILGVIPVINIIAAIALFCLTPILFLMAIVAAVYYGVQAYQGKRFTIPGVTNFLINQGWL